MSSGFNLVSAASGSHFSTDFGILQDAGANRFATVDFDIFKMACCGEPPVELADCQCHGATLSISTAWSQTVCASVFSGTSLRWFLNQIADGDGATLSMSLDCAAVVFGIEDPSGDALSSGQQTASASASVLAELLCDGFLSQVADCHGVTLSMSTVWSLRFWVESKILPGMRC